MKKYYKIFITIILFLLVIFSNKIKDTYNVFLEKVLLVKDSKIMIEDDMVNTYINGLEREISNFKEISELDNCINATVIYRNPNYWYDTFIINKGALDGINKKDIVINNKGLVGVVTDIYDNTSSVSLITNKNKDMIITVGITNGKDTIYGIIDKYNKIKNELIIEELTSEIEGDNLDVVTTNFTGTFIENIIIAKVKKIENNKDGLSNYAISIPVVDYNNLKYVCIVK